MAVKVIAGHTFEDTPGGYRCTASVYREGESRVCNVRWVEIRNATHDDIIRASPGFAHSGCLNAAELKQIEDERLREDAALWAAVTDASSSGSR